MFDAANLLGKMFDDGKSGYGKGGFDKGSFAKGGGGKPGYDDGSYDKKAAYAKESAGYDKGGFAKKPDAGDDDVIAAKKAAYAKSQGQGGWGGTAPTAAAAGGVGGLLGGLASLFGGGRSATPSAPSTGLAGRWGTTAAQVGGLALIGGLAYAAWNRYRSGQSQPAAASSQPTPVAAPPANSGFTPPPQDAAAQNALGTLLIRAMISAAKADGQIDAQETQRIFGEMSAQTLSQAEKAFLMEEIGKPVDVDALAGQARTPQEATQVYAASVMVIDAQTPQETQYLQTLAQKLRLEAPLVAEIHQQVQAAAARPAR